MLRSIISLAAGVTLFVTGVALTVWFYIDWSATHQSATATPLTALADWRGQLGYLVGLLSMPLIYLSTYSIIRRRTS